MCLVIWDGMEPPVRNDGSMYPYYIIVLAQPGIEAGCKRKKVRVIIWASPKTHTGHMSRSGRTGTYLTLPCFQVEYTGFLC